MFNLDSTEDWAKKKLSKSAADKFFFGTPCMI